MDEPKDDSEKLIGRLIRKRRQENAAFKKLLTAINNQGKATTSSEIKSKLK